MNTKDKMQENLSTTSHNQMLDNKGAEKTVKLANYKDYLDLGFSQEKALEYSGLTKENLEQ